MTAATLLSLGGRLRVPCPTHARANSALAVLVAGMLFLGSGCNSDRLGGPDGQDAGPVIPSAPSPSNGASYVSPAVVLHWSPGRAPQGGPVTYDVFFGRGDLPQVADGISATEFDPTPASEWLPYGAGYRWKVVAKDSTGWQASAGPWDFQVVPPPPAGMAYVPPGIYRVGSPTNEPGRNSDEDLHWVDLSLGFLVGRTEVTQAQYVSVMGNNPSYHTDQSGDQPVETVSWLDAIQYCNARSVAEDLVPAYIVDGESVTWDRWANGYRLPTESEWESACRAGTTTPFSSGEFEEDLAQTAWYMGDSEYQPHPVGQKKPNSWKLLDMHGNVSEWCWDWYTPGYPHGTLDDPAIDPAGPAEGWDPQRPYLKGTMRVTRGGSFTSSPATVRSASRASRPPSERSMYVGFRVARTLAP